MVYRVQGFDAILILSQIITLQTFHYFLISLLLPPLLSWYTIPVLLDYSGGDKSIGYVMDWREMCARSTAPRNWKSGLDGSNIQWVYGIDDRRGWIIAIVWLTVSLIDIAPLYYLVRKPTLILDFSLTLSFIHLILTTIYARSFPTSFFWWLVVGTGSLGCVVVAEQLCVRREMKAGLGAEWDPLTSYADGSGEVIELGGR